MNKSETKICNQCKIQFEIMPDDFDFYEKIEVPPPTWCPECRLIRRLAWRNQHFLYTRTCDRCKKSIISVYSKDKDIKVWCSPCWWKDDWAGLEYGVDFDPEKPFLIQVKELLRKLPVMNLFALYTTLVNSAYTNMVSYLKNCYLLFHSDNSENCSYGEFTDNSQDCVDTLILNKSELCYDSVNLLSCHRVFWSVDCEGCHDIYFSRNLIGCSNCFGCANLRNQQYHIFNKPYTKEEYEKTIKQYFPFSFRKIEEIKEQTQEHWLQFPQKYIHERHNANVSGDYIYNSKNTFTTFMASDMEDSRFCTFITPGGAKDNYDFTHYGVKSELTYDSLQVGDQTSRILFSWFAITNCLEIEYSMFVINCKNVFGSVGLKKQQYCILNKQYSKDEYFILRERIIKQMNTLPYKDKLGNEYKYGEFFPVELSPFCYNETGAQEYFPLTKEQALGKGYVWKDPKERNYNIQIPNNKLPDHIKDVKDDIVGKNIQCLHNQECNEQCTQAFKIIPDELQFYRNVNLPLPRLCPNCRHYQRLKQRNPLKLWHRACQCAGRKSRVPNSKFQYENTATHFHGEGKCPNEFETSYAPERPEIVYCESCYNSEVV